MTRRRIVLLTLIPTLVLGAGSELWIHKTFGINTPWDTPDFFRVCGREYRQGGALRNPDTTYTFRRHPTAFDLPIPMPDVSPIPGVANWGGCPLQMVLERRGDAVVYAFIKGGP